MYLKATFQGRSDVSKMKETLKTSLSIDHNEKDGSMYILSECIASIKSKSLNKEDTKSPDDGKF